MVTLPDTAMPAIAKRTGGGLFAIAVLSMLWSGCGGQQASLPVPAGVDSVFQRVAVSRVDVDLATLSSTTAIESFLWDRYADGRHAERFSEVSTENWHIKRQYAVKALQQLAQTEQLNSRSLERCLGAVLPEPGGPVAMVPVGAFLASNGSRKAWIVVCKWEYSPQKILRKAQLRHVQVWALDEETGDVIAQVSCD